MNDQTIAPIFVRCVERAIEFEPSNEMKRLLAKNKETFAQYVVRVLSYSCKTCLALPGMPCAPRAATSKSCGVQFHRSRARAAKCPVTKHFYEPELDDG
jgi:hypothetical protein